MSETARSAQPQYAVSQIHPLLISNHVTHNEKPLTFSRQSHQPFYEMIIQQNFLTRLHSKKKQNTSNYEYMLQECIELKFRRFPTKSS